MPRSTTLLLALTATACTSLADEPGTHTAATTICPSPTLFEHAACVCDSLDGVGELSVLAGPAGDGSIGVNGPTAFVADAAIAGTLHAWGGLSAVGVTIGNLVTPADVAIVGDATMHEANIGGNLSVVGTLAIDGALGLAGEAAIVGTSEIATRVPYAAPAAPPCGCEDGRLFDVAGAVAGAREQLGDNGGLSIIGESELLFTTGSYYLRSADLLGDVQIVIEGDVSLFIEGSLSTVGSAQWTLGPTATLDLFVSGSIASVGDLTAGDPTRAGAVRLYVGGDAASIATVGTSSFNGSIYAPQADVSYVGDSEIVGSIFARTISGVGALTIHHADELRVAQSCLL
jgi:hypothetical protein